MANLKGNLAMKHPKLIAVGLALGGTAIIYSKNIRRGFLRGFKSGWEQVMKEDSNLKRKNTNEINTTEKPQHLENPQSHQHNLPE